MSEKVGKERLVHEGMPDGQKPKCCMYDYKTKSGGQLVVVSCRLLFQKVDMLYYKKHLAISLGQ